VQVFNRTMNRVIFESPIGRLLLVSDGHALTEVWLPGGWEVGDVDEQSDDVLRHVERQLSVYFAGELRDFDLPLAPIGTPFQQRVWQALLDIPYGATMSYSALANRIGAPGAARAVGLANGRNPIAIIIPCHRVIGAAGTLVGYGGGLNRKRWLLDLEAGRIPLFDAEPQLAAAR
jgi:methylated-DNA-[protein]-cysteine S-methyltransferase